jgi:hypothetical protein
MYRRGVGDVINHLQKLAHKRLGNQSKPNRFSIRNRLGFVSSATIHPKRQPEKPMSRARTILVRKGLLAK